MSSSSPSEDVASTDGPRPAPTAVRVAVVVMAIMAGLLLLVTALNLYVLEEQVGGAVTEQALPEDEAQRAILLLLAPYLVFALLFAVSAWFLPRRHAWARWLGLAASAMVATFSVFTALAVGAATLLTLLLFVLSMTAITGLATRTTSAWVRRLRA